MPTHLPPNNAPLDTVREKVSAIFTELVGVARAKNIDPQIVAAGTMSLITDALTSETATPEQIIHADEMAFHLADWNSDSAFITALHLYPERFTRDEVAAGISMLLHHLPYHIHEAARLGGYPAYPPEPPSA